MSLLKALSTAAVAAVLMFGSANARDVTEAELNSLNTVVNDYVKATLDSNYAYVMDRLPPVIMEQMASSVNMDANQFKTMMVQQMQQVAAAMTFESFDFDFDAKKTGELDDGTPYVVIPSVAIIAAPQGKMKVSSDVVALVIDGEWYFVRGDDANQVNIVKQAFPGFEKIELKNPVMEAVQ